MPENYAEGHPLRKDFPLRGRFSRAEQTRQALALEAEDYYIPQELEIAARGGGAVEAETAEGPVQLAVPEVGSVEGEA
ncbi:MAG: hypothetical protein HY703_10055, partial [Gemmatimonadetes bacterium]|nr:hypothetical protein [Gemmatimonadota bacterium]